MPCKCSGISHNECSCKIIGTTPVLHSENVHNAITYIPKRSSHLQKLNNSLRIKYKYNVILNFFERLYEKCASLNLRYCPFPKFIRTKNCFKNTFNDVVILLFFMITNAIVLFIILTKITFHLYFLITDMIYWFRRLSKY